MEQKVYHDVDNSPEPDQPSPYYPPRLFKLRLNILTSTLGGLPSDLVN
jgi:hypothetical protein